MRPALVFRGSGSESRGPIKHCFMALWVRDRGRMNVSSIAAKEARVKILPLLLAPRN